MEQRSSWDPGIGQRLASWPTALVGIVVIKAALSLALPPGSVLVSYSGISYLLLLVLAAAFAVRNGMQNSLGSRPFWLLFAVGCGMWAVSQLAQVYFEAVLRVETPNSSIADPMLFLHLAPLMAALAALPHRSGANQPLRRTALGACLSLLFWGSLYALTVFPYREAAHSHTYDVHFDVLYLAENLAVIFFAGVFALRAHSPWRSVYLHLFGASTLYALSSATANIAMDSGGYVNGKLYGLGLTASVCWFAWIPLRGRQLSWADAGAIPPNSESLTSSWAIVTVVVISIPMAWELFIREETETARMLRILVALAAVGCLAFAAFIREHLLRSEMGSRLGIADNRLHLAMRFGKCVGWDWDLKTDRSYLFGDLHSRFGISSSTYVGHAKDFQQRIHPEDAERVKKAINDAMQGGKKYASEFRFLAPDGTTRWISAEGDFHYAANGEPQRMLGIALDITDRKQAEEALANMTRRVIDAEECERGRIAGDLHEDIGQRLALLAIEIEQLKAEVPDDRPEIVKRMDAVWKQTVGILGDVKASAHELHSPRLQYLGISAVMRSFCEEYAHRKGVQIHFRSQDLPDDVSPDMSLCLFRVLQEALYNALTHSGVRRFDVHLWGTQDEFHLTIGDAGAGFDAEAAMKGPGIGLLGMQERVQLLKGTLSIESQPQRGSTIHARIPLNAGACAKRVLV